MEKRHIKQYFLKTTYLNKNIWTNMKQIVKNKHIYKKYEKYGKWKIYEKYWKYWNIWKMTNESLL
jgi:hypothetical protein